MKEVAQFTRISPQQRLLAMNNYLDNVKNCPAARGILKDWGLRLEDATIDLAARVLSPEVIIFGNGVTHQSDLKADWSGPSSKSSILRPVDIATWAVVFVEKNRQ